ncbi:MAG: GtrA family protein, partial [Pseudorhodobacter sp.]|nr:GtrA family protein [Frankiaceae bacterium]
VSGVIGTAVATVFRFWAYRRWVFTSAPVAVAAAAG